jgi:hypothetical protein
MPSDLARSVAAKQSGGDLHGERWAFALADSSFWLPRQWSRYPFGPVLLLVTIALGTIGDGKKSEVSIPGYHEADYVLRGRCFCSAIAAGKDVAFNSQSSTAETLGASDDLRSDRPA